ncbi:hypothetical protein EL17_16795 [Anditalea andensis]|uniref:Outer membrane protein beta-barrel domain-containing protein n=2 Tax=Anditalea andensis TaxID=1048983 RepID=A0A074LF34_9BACT|nr:hypothetical protein EL17_16795 [Anditalea andensis]
MITLQVYSQTNNWMISSEISPLSRSGNERVLNNPSGLNMEWRNRVGFKLGEQTMMGLSASYRHYSLKEVIELPIGYEYQLNNHLLGIGSFLTQYYHIAPRLHLQTTAYLQVEQGKGTYQNTSLGTGANASNGIMVGVLLPPHLIENNTFRERNFFAGLEFGGSYFITDRWIIQTNINLLQYENYRNTYVDAPQTEITRPVEQEGSGFSFLTDRTIVHFGVMVLLGKN